MTGLIEKPRELVIAAVARNGVIGAGGTIPWHCAQDLRLFRSLTLGNTVVLGRRTFAAIGHPLDGRRNIVLSTTLEAQEGIELARSFPEAVALALTTPEPVFYCGGAQLYRQALERADALYLSWMHLECDGDAFFPEIDPLLWEVESEEVFTDFVHTRYRRVQSQEAE